MTGFPIRNMAFWLARQAELAPAREALDVDGKTYSFEDLEDRAARCAGALTSIGVGPGDRVGALLHNSVEYVDLFEATARIGAIMVPMSPRLAPPELGFIANDSGIRVLVYDGREVETVKAFRPDTAIESVLAVGPADDPSYDAALRGAAPIRSLAEVSWDDVLAIFYTSGTTGSAKGAMLTHGNFHWTNLNMVLALDLNRDERSLVALPMFHLGGWNVNTLPVWWKGGRVILQQSFDAGQVLQRIEEHRVTSMMGVPTMYRMLADHPSFYETDLSSLRVCACGGAPLPEGLIRLWHERGVRLLQGYGLTEAAPNCLLVPPEDAERKVGAAGRPYFFADVRVFDDRDREVGPGGTGEIVVRGPSVMKGYWRQPEATASVLRDGWLRTGDIGRIDDEGYIFVIDRLKDMFISGGENVYPAEIEKVLAGHPAVAEAAVIGVRDDRWGETGRAIVVLREGARVSSDELIDFCASRLAGFKVPRSVFFAEELPRNATGKLIKHELTRRFGTPPPAVTGDVTPPR